MFRSSHRTRLAVGLVTALALAGCSAGQTTTSPDVGPGGVRTDVIIAVALEPVNLDFTTTSGAAIPQLLMNNVYETLVKIDQDGGIVPLLATSWEMSDDGTEYTFHLRRGVTFSDGRPFTSADVVASFDRVQTHWIRSQLTLPMAVVDHTEALDDYTVRVTLHRPSNEWLFSIGTLLGAIFPAEIDFDKMTEAIGTGPYVVAERQQGDRIVLTGREDHWAGPAPLRQVTFRYITDPTAAVNALRAGDVDMLLTTGDRIAPLSNANFQVIEGTSNGEVLLSFNNRIAPFDDLRVRQAFAYAIDREAVMEVASGGFGTLLGAMVPPTDPFFEDLSGMFPFDPDRARELLAEAGYGERDAGLEPLRIAFDVPNIGYATTSAELIVSHLADVGVNATIRILEFPLWLDQVFNRHDFQMSIVMHIEARDLMTVLQPNYYLGFDNSVVGPLAAAADAGSFEEYVEGMREVARLIAAEVPGLVLYLSPNLIVADPALTGIKPNAVTESLDLTALSWTK